MDNIHFKLRDELFKNIKSSLIKFKSKILKFNINNCHSHKS